MQCTNENYWFSYRKTKLLLEQSRYPLHPDCVSQLWRQTWCCRVHLEAWQRKQVVGNNSDSNTPSGPSVFAGALTTGWQQGKRRREARQYGHPAPMSPQKKERLEIERGSVRGKEGSFKWAPKYSDMAAFKHFHMGNSVPLPCDSCNKTALRVCKQKRLKHQRQPGLTPASPEPSLGREALQRSSPSSSK